VVRKSVVIRPAIG